MYEPKYVPGYGPAFAKFVICGEAPGREEDEEGVPFVGQSGYVLDSILEDAEINRNECYLTNVIKYRPPDNNLKRLKEIGISLEDSISDLQKELRLLKPNTVLALGNTALKALTGKDKISLWRGSILYDNYNNFRVIGSYHPANLLPGRGMLKYQARAFMVLDAKRAWENSLNERWVPPARNLRIGRTVLEVYRFLQECRIRGIVAADIECARSIPVCIAFAFDRYNAMSIPFLDIQSARNPTGIPPHEALEILKLVRDFLEDSSIKFIWQNGKFDKSLLENVWMIHCPASYVDTSLLAHTLYPEFPKGLDFLASIFTEEPYYKGIAKDVDFTEGKRRRKPFDKNALYIYNARDTAVDFEVYEKQVEEAKELGVHSFFFNHVMRQDDFYRRMESRGFLTDEKKRLELLDKYLTREADIKRELKELIGRSINYRSQKDVIEVLYNDLKFAKPAGNKKPDAKEETLVMLMANHCANDKDDRRRRILRNISIGRRVSKTIGTYLLSPPDYDGRMRTVYRLAVTEDNKNGGTETGRTSTSLLKQPVRPEKMGWALQTITKHGDIGQDVSEILIADPGYVFISVDMSQAEARLAANYSSDEDTLKRFNTEDIHRRTASWCFGVPYEKIDKKDPKRQIGKTTRYLRQYKGGKRRLMHSIMSDAFRFGIDVYVSEKQCGKIIDVFDSYTPLLARVFWADVESALERDRTLITPHGRRRQFFGRGDENLLREAYPYLCSATVRDHLTMAMFRIEDKRPDTLFMMEWHDAFTVMVKEDDVEWYRQNIPEELEKPINFDKCTLKRKDIVIPCEMKIGKNLYKMEDLKHGK